MAAPAFISMIRVSMGTQTAEDKTSIEKQRDEVQEAAEHFAKVNGWVDWSIEKEYDFPGISGFVVGKTLKHQMMMEHLARPHIYGLVIPRIDRLSRDDTFSAVGELAKPFEEMIAGKNKKLCMATRVPGKYKEVDVTNREDRVWMFAELNKAAEEREVIVFRTSKAKERLRKRVNARVDPPPEGIVFTPYEKGKNIGVFSYDPEFKARMHETYLRVLAGDSLATIAAEFRPESELSSRIVRCKPLRPKSATGLKVLLRSPWWIGHKPPERIFGKKEFSKEDGKYKRTNLQLKTQPITLGDGEKGIVGFRESAVGVRVPELADNPCVTRDIWDKVQQILNKNATHWTQKNSYANQFLVIGIGFCSCGRKLYHIQSNRKSALSGREWKCSYYRCSYKSTIVKSDLLPCNERMIRTSLVDDEIKLQMRLLTDKRYVRMQLRERQNKAAVVDKQNIVDKYEADILRLQRERANVASGLRKAPNVDVILNELKEVDLELADTVSKVTAAKRDLAAFLSDEDVDIICEMLHAEFRQFDMLPINEQKQRLMKYVIRIDVIRDEFAGVILRFTVKVGAPRAVFQHKPTIPISRPSSDVTKEINPSIRVYDESDMLRFIFVTPRL